MVGIDAPNTNGSLVSQELNSHQLSAPDAALHSIQTGERSSSERDNLLVTACVLKYVLDELQSPDAFALAMIRTRRRLEQFGVDADTVDDGLKRITAMWKRGRAADPMASMF